MDAVAPVATESVDILLVDDNPVNLDALAAVLDPAAYRLVRAHSAQEALLALLEGEFAAIVLDIEMPGLNGIELRQRPGQGVVCGVEHAQRGRQGRRQRPGEGGVVHARDRQ